MDATSGTRVGAGLTGIKLPCVELKYTDLSYSVFLTPQQQTRDVESVWERYFQILTFPYQIGKSLYTRVTGGGTKMMEIKVIQEIDGCIKPGVIHV